MSNLSPQQASPGSSGSGGQRVLSLAYSVAAGALLSYALLLCTLSWLLQSGSISIEHGSLWLATGGAAAGGLYLASLLPTRRRHAMLSFRWIMGVAIAARLVVSMAPPMLESDYQRYLWDGAVTANGINPYRYAPSEMMLDELEGVHAQKLDTLSERAGGVLERVNHPTLTTIYPPVAQGAFALAYFVEPLKPLGLRVVFGLADLATLLLLARLLVACGLPASQLVWYAWNPLLLREVYSSLHMDMLLLPLIVLAMLGAVRAKGGLAVKWLVIASAVKVWPIALAPLFMRPLWGNRRRFIMTLAMSAALGVVLWLPVLLVPMNANSGFVAYGKGWQNNDGYFRAGIWLTERAFMVLGIEPWHSHAFMRVLTVMLLGVVLLWQLRSKPKDAGERIGRGLVVVGAIFVLSPTQFPWYWLWCLPMLTIIPNAAMLLYVALLPMYYAQDQIVYPMSHWIQHAPVWGLLLIAAARGFARRSRTDLRAMEVDHA